MRKELSALEIIKSGIHYYIAGAVMLAVLLFMRDYFTPSINTLYLVVIGVATYFLSLIILRDDFLLSNVNTIFKKVLKRA